MKRLLPFVLLASLASAAHAQCAANFSFNDFSQHAALTATGSAAFTNNIMRLTPDTDGQAGSVWYTASKASVAAGFSTTFTFRTGPGSNYADGFAFVLQNEAPNALGDGGSGMGYGANGSHGITKSVAVEFDTFSFFGEIDADHVSIQTDGIYENQVDDNYSLGYAVLPMDINDGELHTARVVYTGTLMLVYVDDMNTPAAQAPVVLTNINGDSILDPSGCIWIGFTGGTGAATATQDIESWQFVNNSGLTPCGATFDLTDFAQHSTISTTGNASFVGNALRLTNNVGGQSGAAWLTSSKANLSVGFDTVFTFRTGPGTNAADGFAFVIQNESASATADGGSGMGYGNNGTHGITRSVAIEFDTFAFSGEFDADHVSVQTDGNNQNQPGDAYSLGHITIPVDINDGQVHTARIRYTTGTLLVFVDDINNVLMSIPLDLSNINGDNILDVGGCAWVGFTGGTGLATATQDILSWQFTDAITCASVGVSQFDIVFSTGAGSRVDQHITVFGTGPKTYRWVLNGNDLVDDGRITGSHTDHLVIDPVTQGDAGLIEFHAENTCSGLGTGWQFVVCGTSDFDGDGDSGTDADIEAFFACLGGNCCSTCQTSDFNSDGDSGTDADIESFFRVLGGGPC